MNSIKISLLVFIVSITISAQWSEAYYNIGGFWNLSFTDSLNGWFTHYGVDKIIHTSDGGHTFNVQQVTPGAYDMADVYMIDSQNGWCSGSGIGGGPGMIHRTTNGGTTWVQITHPAPNGSWNDISKVGNAIWFVGGYGSEQGIVMKTTDNGQTWIVETYPSFGTLNNIEVIDEQNILISGRKSIYRSSNNGSSWTEVSQNQDPDYWFYKLCFVNQNVGYAIGSNPYQFPIVTHLFITTDSGLSWNVHYLFYDGQKTALSVIPETETIFVAGDVTAINSGILKSTDGGVTWNTMLTNYRINAIYTPSIYHGWAGAGAMIYRYDYVTPPVIEPIGNTHIQFGEPFTYQVNATGIGLTYSMSGNPPGLSIGSYSGLIDGTPTIGGKFDITVAVTDTAANVVNEEFNLRVNRKPNFITIIEDTIFTQFNLLYEQLLEAEDIDEDTLTFAALVIPNFLTLTQGEHSAIYSATVSGIPTEADTGYHSIQIEVIDGYGGSETISWVLCVDNVTDVNNNETFLNLV